MPSFQYYKCRIYHCTLRTSQKVSRIPHWNDPFFTTSAELPMLYTQPFLAKQKTVKSHHFFVWIWKPILHLKTEYQFSCLKINPNFFHQPNIYHLIALSAKDYIKNNSATFHRNHNCVFWIHTYIKMQLTKSALYD